MKNIDIEKCMKLMADMYDFDRDAFGGAGADDPESTELFEDDLELLSAAGYQALMEKLRRK